MTDAVAAPTHPSTFGVHWRDASDLVCVVHWNELDDQLEFRLHASDEAVREKVAAALGAAFGSPLGRRLTPEESTQLWSRIRERLSDDGFSTCEMPGGDFQ